MQKSTVDIFILLLERVVCVDQIAVLVGGLGDHVHGDVHDDLLGELVQVADLFEA